MDPLQLAIGLVILERFDWEVVQRVEVGARYDALIGERGLAKVQQQTARTVMSLPMHLDLTLAKQQGIAGMLDASRRETSWKSDESGG